MGQVLLREGVGGGGRGCCGEVVGLKSGVGARPHLLKVVGYAQGAIIADEELIGGHHR